MAFESCIYENVAAPICVLKTHCDWGAHLIFLQVLEKLFCYFENVAVLRRCFQEAREGS